MKRTAACLLAACISSPAHAQFPAAWKRMPAVTVIGAAGDPRLAVVDEAIAYWNTVLADLGSGFRLGPVTRQELPVPEEGLRSLSESILASRGARVEVPQALRGLPGDLTIVLAESNFISFAGPFDPDRKRVVGIKGARFFPMNLPNVPRNLIAHELGHAIGLGHNANPAMLMCGRPAPCRPDVYNSSEPRLFPLTDDERRRLLAMYPPDWKPAR